MANVLSPLALARASVASPNGGIGIRVRLKIEWRNPYGFKSHFGHHNNSLKGLFFLDLCLSYSYNIIIMVMLEKRSVMIRPAFFLLGFTFLSMLFLSLPVAHAEDSVVTTTTITISESCSMTGTINTPHNASVINGTYSGASYPNGIGQTTLKAFCNDSAGFAIYAIGYTDDEYGNTKLHSSALGSTYDINTDIYNSGSASSSTWSMKLTSVSGAYAPTIADGTNGLENFTTWHVVPTTYTKVAYRSSATDTENGGQGVGSMLTTTYDAYVSATQPAGTYVGQVKYTLVHPNMSDDYNKPVTPLTATDCPARNVCYAPNADDVEGSMSSIGSISGSPRAGKISISANYFTLIAPNYSRPGYGFAGWSTKWDAVSAYNNNETVYIYGPNEYITTTNLATNESITFSSQGLILYPVWIASAGNLQGTNGQGWTGCSSLTQAPTNTRATLASMTALKDTRDNNVYAVARLADGKCWMVENLRLDAENTRGDTNKAKAQGYGDATDSAQGDLGKFIGLADSENTNFSSTAPTIVNNATNSLYSSDGSTEINIGSGSNPGYRMPRYNNDNINRSLTASYNGAGHYQWYSYGNYYTWSAAIADTAYYNQNNLSVTTTSICPAGWRLPEGGQAYAAGDTGGVNVTNSPSTYRDFYNLGYSIMGSVAYDSQANNGSSYYDSATTNTAGDTADKALRKFPNNFVYSGWFNGSSAGSRNSYGYYWSSSALSNAFAYDFYIYNYYAYPGTINRVNYTGHTVRCVLQSNN